MRTIKLYSVFILLTGMLMSHPVYSGTLTIGEPVSAGVQLEGEGGIALLPIGEITLLSPSISVEGNLYLDYSVFSDYDYFLPAGMVSFDAQQVLIFPGSVEAPIINLNNLTVYSTLPDSYIGTEDTLFFSDLAIIDGQFSATENIYIGNYSDYALTAVPVPAAFWFFVSGLSLLLSRKARHI